MKSPEMGMDTQQSPENQEDVKYRIAWKSRITDATGHGEYVDKKTAEGWLEKVNKDHPELEHWLEAEEKE
jgi:hypothetical protein